MGFYSTQGEKRDDIKEQLILLQSTAEEIDAIVRDHAYVELEPLTEKLLEIYEHLERRNNQGVGLIL